MLVRSLSVRQTLNYKIGVTHIIIYIALSEASTSSLLHAVGEQKHSSHFRVLWIILRAFTLSADIDHIHY